MLSVGAGQSVWGSAVSVGGGGQIFFSLLFFVFKDNALKVTLRAEIAAIISFLFFSIPLYPVAHIYPLTGMNSSYRICNLSYHCIAVPFPVNCRSFRPI